MLYAVQGEPHGLDVHDWSHLHASEGTGGLHEPPRAAVIFQAQRRARNQPWAIRKAKHRRIAKPEELVKVDTKEVQLAPGVVLKHSESREAISRWDSN